MSELNAISAFMRAVVPWPGSEQEPGYVSIWYGFTVPDKKQPMFVGWPYKDISKFMAGAKWCIDHPDRAPAVYFCTSLQAKKRTKLKNGKQRDVASKSAADAISLKAIWIDIDVRPKDASGKHYVSFNEAGKAIDAFVKKHGLPTPTIVHSGGGFHVYWISDKALTPDEWHPYASGLKALLMQDQLKCDHGLTTDAARILRLPGSVNRKNPLQPVEVGVLKNFPVVQYDFKLLDFLKQHATEAAPKHTSTSVFADGVDPKIFTKPSSVFPPSNELSLSAGIERLVDFRPIFSKGGCPMYRDAFKNGGAGLSQPLWHLQILGTVFMENGNAIAHEISKEHTSYTPDSTDEMFGRKVAERNSIGLGYPSCATFKGAGCTACEGCPLLGKIKSPLNIRPGPNHSGGTGGQQTPKAGKKSGDSAGERLVVPKDDHMDRARIYRNRKRPNLYHYRDDYYDHEGGHYTIIADDTIRADLYGFLDHCDKEVPCKGKPAETKVVSFAPNKSSVSETGEALKAVGHVMPTVEQPHWLDRRTGPNPADLICFPNGILNINSNQFTPPDPMLFTPHGVGFDYDPNAAAPIEWLNFLDQVFNGEKDQIESAVREDR